MFSALRCWAVSLSVAAAVGAPVATACDCHQGYSPYAAGYSPYAAGYSPYAAGYSPYAAGYAASYLPQAAYYSTYYAPQAAYYAPQAACYAPQTTYRPYVVNVPVAGYQTEIASDPCTGCPVTVMRPVTTYVQQVQYSSVVTYRPVTCCSPSACCAAPCHCGGGCGCAASGVPSTTAEPGPMTPSTVPAPALPNGPVPSTFRETPSGYYYGAPPPQRLPDRTATRATSTVTVRSVSAQPPARPATDTTRQAPRNDGWRAAKR